MTPIYFKVGNQRRIKVIPNVQAHVDGHPVLTYTYNIYEDGDFDYEHVEATQESELLLERKLDPHYMGFITFEDPGKMFSYTADGHEELSSDEVEEIIENISHYRDHPGMWQMD